MPTELPDSAKVLRNDVGKRMADALEAIAEGSGGSAKIEEMTQAEYDALTPAQKADGTLRAISDGQTKIQDIDNVNITTSDGGKILGVSVSGDDISVGAVEMTASNIPYSSGVSVADMLDVEDLSSQVILRSGYDIASWGYIKLIKYGHLCHLSFSGVGTSSSITSDTPIFDLPVTALFFSAGSAFQRSGSVNRNFNILIDANTTQIKCNAFEPSSYAYGCITFFV